MDILDLSEVDITAGGFLYPAEQRRKTGSLPVYDMHRWGVGGSNLGQTQS